MEKYCRVGQATDGNIAHGHCIWVLKATNAHADCAIIIAFPLQQSLYVLT